MIYCALIFSGILTQVCTLFTVYVLAVLNCLQSISVCLVND